MYARTPYLDIYRPLFLELTVNKKLCELPGALRKACSLPSKGQVKLCTLWGPTKLSGKEHSLAHFRQQCKCMHDLRKMGTSELQPTHMLQVAPQTQSRLV